MSLLHLLWRSLLLAVSWSGSTAFWVLVVASAVVVDKFPSLRHKPFKEILHGGWKELGRSTIYVGIVAICMFILAIMVNIHDDHEKWMGLAQSRLVEIRSLKLILQADKEASAQSSTKITGLQQDLRDAKDENEHLKLESEIAGKVRPTPPAPTQTQDLDNIFQFGTSVGRIYGAIQMPSKGEVFFKEINSAEALNQKAPFQWGHYTLKVIHADLPTLYGMSISGMPAQFIIPNVECAIQSKSK